MLWHKITLNKREVDLCMKLLITKDFRELHARAGSPPHALLLESKLPDQTGAIEIYFSPRAAEIAENTIDRLSGIPCNSPPRSQVNVLYGPDGDLDLHDLAA